AGTTAPRPRRRSCTEPAPPRHHAWRIGRAPRETALLRGPSSLAPRRRWCRRPDRGTPWDGTAHSGHGLPHYRQPVAGRRGPPPGTRTVGGCSRPRPPTTAPSLRRSVPTLARSVAAQYALGGTGRRPAS